MDPVPRLILAFLAIAGTAHGGDTITQKRKLGSSGLEVSAAH